jgi:hypothetical protein
MLVDYKPPHDYMPTIRLSWEKFAFTGILKPSPFRMVEIGEALHAYGPL